jgi:ABC-2 type transport system permease protein
MSAWQTVRLIAGREVRQRLRSRMFVGTTLVLSALLVLGALVPALLGTFDRGPDDEPGAAEPVTVAVVGTLAAAEVAALEAALGPLTTSPAADEAAAVAVLEDGSADLAVVVGERVLAPPATGMFAIGTGRAFQAAEALALTAVLDTVGASGAAAAVLGVEPLPVEVVGEDDQVLQAARLIAANLAVVFIFAMVMFYASMIVNGIIEEKGSRVVELLVEAVPTRQLLAGKVLGLGAIALGQMLVLFVPATAVLVLANRDRIPAGIGGMLAIVGLWFVLGYALYTLVAAGLGALVSRPEEAQAVLTPASLLALAGYVVGFAAIQAPDATFAVVAGWVPFSAPFVMPVRQLVGDPTALEVGGALGLVTVTIVVVAHLAARIYEGGILRVGARVGVRDAWRGSTT